MASTTSGQSRTGQPDNDQPKTAPGKTVTGKQAHHGRTLAAWTGTTIALVAFIIGGIAVLVQNWPLFWVGVAVLIVGLVVAKILQATGHGAH